jgi:deazaflavin-dependent oxidoreductase (nitroreductase family)
MCDGAVGSDDRGPDAAGPDVYDQNADGSMLASTYSRLMRGLAADLTTVDITTVGRASGEPRRLEIWLLRIDDRFFITGTPGRRGWLANLTANPMFTVHLKDDVIADLDARATPVADESTRRAVLTHSAAAWYRSQVALETLVAAAPMVEVVFTGR